MIIFVDVGVTQTFSQKSRVLRVLVTIIQHLMGRRNAEDKGEVDSKMKSRLMETASSLQYLTDWRSVFISSSFHIRRGLYLQIKKNANNISGDILDFGCGSKPYQKLFSNCSSYVGVDLQVSGHNHKDSKVDVFYDGNELPFLDDAFDTIVSFEVLEHVPNVDKILKEVRRVLKPGGSIYLTIPFMYPEHEMPYDFQRWTSLGIRNLLSDNDFGAIQIVKTNTSIQALGQNLVDYIFNNIFPTHGSFKKFVKLPFIPFFNSLIFLANMVLPKRDNYYSNLFIKAVRIK